MVQGAKHMKSNNAADNGGSSPQPKPQPKSKRRRKRLPRWADRLITIVIILIGVGLMTWPWILDRLEASGVFNQISTVSSTVDALSAEERERILAATQEERAKLREAAAYGEEERERIRRDTEEERDRFYAKLQMRLNAQQRRTIYSFPHLTLTRNNEVLDGLRQNMEKVRQRAKKTS